MARLFWLSDQAWALIDPYLPRGRPGRPRFDDHRVIGGLLHVLKTGRRWRDVPAEHGPAGAVCNATTGGGAAGCGSACSRRPPRPARSPTSSPSTART
jgi:transposase